MDSLNPWYPLYSYAPPHFPFCGVMSPGYITDPADTYTSFFYLLAAYLIYLKSRSSKGTIQYYFYLIPVIITVGSLLFHMSFTYIFLMADFIGIFILTFYCLAMNLLRLDQMKTGHFLKKVYAVGFFYMFSMIISYKINIHSGVLMIPPLAYTAYLEIKCFRLHKNIQYKNFLIGCSLAFIGYLFMLFEGIPFHIGCEGTPFYFHSIWHLLSAISFYFIYLFYEQFNIRYKR